MSFIRIYHLTKYYLLTFRNNIGRIILIVFWPFFDLLIWGYTTIYLQTNQNSENIQSMVAMIIGVFIFWTIVLKAQQEIAAQFNEDIYSKNLSNILISPIKNSEIIFALILSSMVKIIIISLVLIISSYMLYSFNLFKINTNFLYPLSILYLFGWSLGIMVTAIILRFGIKFEFLAWSLALFLQPFSCVFYPRTTLPYIFNIISWFIPSSYAFEYLRKIFLNNSYIQIDSTNLFFGLIISLLYFLSSIIFFNYMMKSAKKNGTLARM